MNANAEVQSLTAGLRYPFVFLQGCLVAAFYVTSDQWRFWSTRMRNELFSESGFFVGFLFFEIKVRWPCVFV